MNERPQPNEHCVDMGILVSLRDDELTAGEAERISDHVATCPDCFADKQQSIVHGREIYALLAELGPTADKIPAVDVAFAALQSRLVGSSKQQEHPITVHTLPMNITALPRARKYHRAGWLVAGVAAVLVAMLLLPNASAFADQFLSLFRPQQFQPVTINIENMRTELLPHLQDFADVHMNDTSKTPPENPTITQVKAAIDFPLLLPDQLPAGVSPSAHYSVVSGTKGTFTLNMQKARVYLNKSGQNSVTIPVQLNGTTFTVDIKTGVTITYDNNCRVEKDRKTGATQAPQVQCSNSGDQLFIAEIPSPTIQATGKASLKDLRDFALSLPKLSPLERTLLQQLDLETGTIPIPIPEQLQSQQVTVQGVSGLQIADDSLKIGIVLWQKDGIIYLVMSTSGSGADILTTARSLR